MLIVEQGTNNAHCGTSVIRYTVTSQTGQTYTVAPRGPEDNVHHGAFRISPQSQTVSAMVSISSDIGQVFWVRPIARFLSWNGTSFTTLSTQVMGSAVQMTGDQAWVTITRFLEAPASASHWRFELAVSADSAGTTPPSIGTRLYLDCAFVPDNGADLTGVPYLDGDADNPDPYGKACWEGDPHNSTSIYCVPVEPEESIDPLPDDEGGGDSDGNTDLPDDPTVEPPFEPPPPIVFEPIPLSPQDQAELILTGVDPSGLCLNGDIQLGYVDDNNQGMIFNRIDEHGVLWLVSQIEGWWTLPEPDIPDFPRGIDDGSYEARGRYQPRIFTVSGSFVPTSRGDVRAARDRLIRAVNLCHYGAWFATHEPDATRAAKVWLSGQPNIDTVNVNGRTDFSIGLKAPDPIKYQLDGRTLPGWRSFTLSSQTTAASFGRTYPRTYPWSYPNAEGGVFAAEGIATNSGNIRVSPTIIVTGPTAGPIRIYNDTTQQMMRVRHALAPGEELIIDCQNRTAALNSLPNKRFYLDVVTDWIYIDVGPNKIYFIEEEAPSLGTITVQWRSGWIG